MIELPGNQKLNQIVVEPAMAKVIDGNYIRPKRRPSLRRRRRAARTRTSFFTVSDSPQVYKAFWRRGRVLKIVEAAEHEAWILAKCKGCGCRVKHDADVCVIEQALYLR